MIHTGKIAPSLYFRGKWIAKCRCGWMCIGPLRALRKAGREHKTAWHGVRSGEIAITRPAPGGDGKE